MATIENKARQIFEYLLAIKNSSSPVERDMSKYNPVLWQEEIPFMEGCFLYGNGNNENAWLEVHKQDLTPPPAPPQILQPWITSDIRNPEIKPLYYETKLQSSNEVYFRDSEERVNSWQDWILTWEKWAEVMIPKYKIQKLYSELFSLNQRFQREEEIIEFVWGHGLLKWNKNGQKISRHLFVTRMEFVFLAEKGIFEIVPSEKGTVMETDMLNGIDIPNIEQLSALNRRIQEAGINPINPELLKPVYDEIVNTLSPRGKTNLTISLAGNVKGTDDPVIYNVPALFVRDKTKRQWQMELNGIIDAIDEGHPIPPLITGLTTEEGLNNVLPTDFIEETQKEWKPVGEEIFFPLVSNLEQKEIIKRLTKSYGVTVQGPPGTGKSHTIANLICHLLAHGKRVLVTSHTERALRVLSEKIPKNVRSLCVTVTGGDTSSIKEIEASIRSISDNLSLDVDLLEREVDEHKMQLSEIRNTITALRYHLKQVAVKENTSIMFDDREKMPWEICEWLHKNTEHGWILDNIPFESAIPKDEKISRFFYLAGSLKKEDLDAINMHRPDIAKLPTPMSFSELVISLNREQTVLELCKKAMDGWHNSQDIYPLLDEVVLTVENAIAKMSGFNQPWIMKVLNDVSKGGLHKENWQSLLNDCRNDISEISNYNRQLAPYKIICPTNISLAQLQDDFKHIYLHVSNGGNLNWMFMNVTGRKSRYVIEETTINSAKIKDINDLKILQTFIEKNIRQETLINRWNAYVSDVNGETFSNDQQRIIARLDDNLNIIQTALEWEETVINPLQPIIVKLGLDPFVDWTNHDWLQSLKAGFLAMAQEKKFLEIVNRAKNLKTFLQQGSSISNAHSTWNQLLKALNKKDSMLWDSTLTELRRLVVIESQKRELEDITGELGKLAPLWVNKVLNSGGDGRALEPPHDWKKAWRWGQAQTWFNKFQDETDIQRLYQDISDKEVNEAKLIEEIVAKSAWIHQVKNTTESQKRSLHAWIQTIKRIGKGTGKYADKHRRDAKLEMEKCQDAIPVWVMPLHRVIENLKITNKPFDVVIVDESSQSDVFALAAFFRAKKAIVVGDDKQISPENVGRDQSDINDLIVRYLSGIPQKERLDLQTSLYEIALRIFPGNLMLKEHFRCVPEIIQFSNDQFYGGEIEELRMPNKSEMLDPPIRTIRVINGRREESTAAINFPEAQSLVEQVVACCEDDNYSGKTMGIISLQGFEQARVIEEILRDKLGDLEITKRRIICGDAYSFQGDERDVMFLSMVAASNMRIGALTKLTDEKRFNVAASRARDQVWLFHSVDLDDLNPNCMRARLLRYYLNPARTIGEEEKYDKLFESKFERDVFKLISARGYAVRPQVKVGRYNKRIDMVVEGMRNRLAIECDGDQWHGPDKWEQDQDRQRLLERVGWVFWRVTASAFYRDSDKAMRSLWVKLDEMGVEPSNIL